MTDNATDENHDEAPDFENALKELEDVVTRLEKGDLSLEASLQHFERGVALTRHCQKALQEAEQKVESLLGDQDEPQPYDPEGSADD
jgi:exodeoxyribonuclease VII small subunit